MKRATTTRIAISWSQIHQRAWMGDANARTDSFQRSSGRLTLAKEGCGYAIHVSVIENWDTELVAIAIKIRSKRNFMNLLVHSKFVVRYPSQCWKRSFFISAPTKDEPCTTVCQQPYACALVPPPKDLAPTTPGTFDLPVAEQSGNQRFCVCKAPYVYKNWDCVLGKFAFDHAATRLVWVHNKTQVKLENVR